MRTKRFSKTRSNAHLGASFALLAILLALPLQVAQAQVQCLIPNNDQNGLATFQNTCDVDIVLELKIGNPDFDDHRCFSTQTDVFPCQHIARANGKAFIEIPIGDLQGAYRACYLQDLGTPTCEFTKQP